MKNGSTCICSQMPSVYCRVLFRPHFVWEVGGDYHPRIREEKTGGSCVAEPGLEHGAPAAFWLMLGDLANRILACIRGSSSVPGRKHVPGSPQQRLGQKVPERRAHRGPFVSAWRHMVTPGEGEGLWWGTEDCSLRL